MNWQFLRNVRLELPWLWKSGGPGYAYGLIGILSLLLLGLLGATLTQYQPEHRILSRSQWQVLQAQRQTRQEVARMIRDLARLTRLGALPRPDPVESAWMAQRLYGRYQDGTPSSAAARQALIEAGRIAVQVASGSRQPEHLEAALQAVQQLLVPLQTP